MAEPSRRQLQRWKEQWDYAAKMLPVLEFEELRALPRKELLKRIDAVLSFAGDPAYSDPERWSSSGLVEQQRLFRRLGQT